LIYWAMGRTTGGKKTPMSTYKPDLHRLQAICLREFDQMARTAREERNLNPRVPIIGGRYRQDQRIKQILQVCRALAAQEWHEQTCPQWARGWALPLPVREEEFETFLRNEHNEIRLLGLFGRSVRESGWDYEHRHLLQRCIGRPLVPAGNAAGPGTAAGISTPRG
jgi:hypothetical protein